MLPMGSKESGMSERIKTAFFDMHRKIGIAWTEKDGKRDSIRLDIPEEVAQVLSDIAHNRR